MNSSIDYSHLPALDPPPGITANFIDPPSIASSVVEVSLPLSVVSTIFVALRIYTRWKVVKSLGWDDLLVVLGLGFLWIFCVLGIIDIQYGFGVDIWNLYASSVFTFQKLNLASQAFFHLALLCTKCSILFTLARLYTNPKPTSIFRISAFLVMAFIFVYSLASISMTVFACSPKIQNAKCGTKALYVYVYSTCNIASSWATLGLGVAACLRKKAMGKGAVNTFRWCMGFVIVIGCFVCFTSIIRLIVAIPHIQSDNFTRSKVFIARWCEIEVASSLILASLLTLHPLLSALLPSHFPPHHPSTAPHPDTEMSTPSLTASRTRKMSELTSNTIGSQLSTSTLSTMSRASSRRDVSLEVSENGLAGNGGGISQAGRRVLGGVAERKGPVVKTVVYDVKYEA